MKKTILLTALVAIIAVAGCKQQQTADERDTQQQNTITAEAQREVGLPNITNFAEKRTLKLVEETADKQTPAYLYLFSQIRGCFVSVGTIYGYPIPYATQYTNPGTYVYGGGGAAIMPQADPNGLFKPAAAAGTWVLMMDPITHHLAPQYLEDNVEAFTFKQENICSQK